MGANAAVEVLVVGLVDARDVQVSRRVGVTSGRNILPNTGSAAIICAAVVAYSTRRSSELLIGIVATTAQHERQADQGENADLEDRP